MIPDVGWGRGGEWEIVAITYSQLPIPNYLFPITYSQLSIACECDRATKEPRQFRQSGQQWREYWRVRQICLAAE